MYIPTTQLSQAQAAGIDGWVDDTANAWTYASASTFTTTGDRTVTFSKGTRIKCTNSTLKYFVVASSSFGAGVTTVTITGGSDYSLANAAISANYYSYAENPQGYPDYFFYTPSWTSTGTAPSLGNGSVVGYFALSGKTLTVVIHYIFGSTTTFGTGAYRFSIPSPFTAPNTATAAAAGVQQGVSYRAGIALILATNSVFNVINSVNAGEWSNTIPHTWVSTDEMYMTLVIPISI